MVLHLIPIDRDDPFDALRAEIRLSPTDPKPSPPRMSEWTADTKEQTITHIASGCRFHAYRLKPPLVQGLVLPFEHSYEIVVRFVGMADNANLPPVEEVRELGRQGLIVCATDHPQAKPLNGQRSGGGRFWPDIATGEAGSHPSAK